jgi:hypothetical protein
VAMLCGHCIIQYPVLLHCTCDAAHCMRLLHFVSEFSMVYHRAPTIFYDKHEQKKSHKRVKQIDATLMGEMGN